MSNNKTSSHKQPLCKSVPKGVTVTRSKHHEVQLAVLLRAAPLVSVSVCMCVCVLFDIAARCSLSHLQHHSL